MAGMINSGKEPVDTEAPPAPTDSKQPDDHDGSASGMLAQIEKNIESKLPPELKKEYLSIVVAGRQMMFSDKTHQFMADYFSENIHADKDVPNVVAHGIVKLISILFEQSKGAMSVPASAPAAITLMSYALKYVDDQWAVTKEVIDATTTATITGLFALWKVPPEKIQEAIQSAGKQQPDAATEPTMSEAAIPEGME